MTAIVRFGWLAPWLLIAGQSWLLYQVLRKEDQIGLKIQAVEKTLGGIAAQAGPQREPSLEVGTVAPEFTLPDLSGRDRTLGEFLGKPLVVNFFSPDCGFCQQMAPRLGNLSEAGPQMLVITHGEADATLRLASEHKWRCAVVRDPTGQVTRTYKISGTPSGYLLDADGRVASELAEGADALLDLLAAPADAAEQPSLESLRRKEEKAVERARQAGLSVRESGLNRQGLEPGTKAPEFTLPDLEGVQRSLTSFLDKRILLVFSDPNCGPCEALAPDLVRLHREHADNNLQVLMISRGDPRANQEKARKHELPFPVLLQRQWEISKDYAMFATPIGYLIERDGVIAKPVAVGKNSILELVAP